MDDLILPATQYTPEIHFEYSRHRLLIGGESYPENTSEFYTPVFKSLKVYLDDLDGEEVTVILRMRYFNSSSSKILMNFFDLLEMAGRNNNTITVNWYYRQNDTDAMEFGQEFSVDLNAIRFNIIAE